MYIVSSVGHPRSDLFVMLVLWTIVCKYGAPILYYWLLEIVPTLMRMNNISSRSYGLNYDMILILYHIIYLYYIHDKV
jgi:hypothetical protein